VNFYDAVEAATSDAAQVRYGIVPYASNVNVGRLLPSAYIASSANYQSRRPQWRTDTWWDLISTQFNSYSNPGNESNSGNYNTGSQTGLNQQQCTGRRPAAQNPTYVGPLTNPVIVTENVNGTTRIRVITGRGGMQRGEPYANWTPASRWNPSQCNWGLTRRTFNANVQVTTREEYRENDVLERWVFEQRTFPEIAALRTGNWPR